MLSRFFSISYRFPKVGTAPLAVAAAITAAIGTLALTAPSQANETVIPTGPVVSLQFGGNGNASSPPPVLGPGYGAITNSATTAGVVSEPYWNYQIDGIQNYQAPAGSPNISTQTANGGTTNAGGILLNSTGASSGVTYSYSYTRVSGTNGNTFPSGGDQDLATEAAGVQSNGNATLSLSGITAANYDIIAYVNPMYFGSNPTLEEIGLGGTNYYLNSSNTLGAWTQSTATSSATATTGNYVEFDNLSGSSQTLTVFDNGSYYGLDGIQIIPSAVPEPAALGLMAVAGAGLLLVKRRSPSKA